ncbi:hypothetical protein MGG_04971 [Pyricularia oryzae 70-15]|uniref:Uncharacterized protein n=1 Tax=Pyricularia oryzae (strain 70-15 / ATCC MYA-4617 / FGSC 8958) TaxID=242507 RepID=G4N3I6_PYRO7|nr:uncharacterized protein MGG_04971 [Pyricularia oryzae 70-15]EHA52661.1 hypothetical protein MGG_04971 [Pyricularia oryzae 70-15]KAI7930346.1 hypothetical protein M9X92_000783 [Pyricularia oryzae]KAI7932046.1 hypothetical protein M0657_000771 [Pyricularia oryzae]
MDKSLLMSKAGPLDGDVAVMDAEDEARPGGRSGTRARDAMEGMAAEPSPLTKTTRSFSDGDGTPGRPKLSPSPLILETDRRMSKDDSAIRNTVPAAPVTPSRPDFVQRGSILSSSLHMSQQATGTAAAGGRAAGFATDSLQSQQQVKQPPLSPKLDHSHIYASPTSALPRRSRGLDFSRAATSLHHSTLAEQSSPDSSPTHGGRGAMNIPGGGSKRFGSGFGAAETSTNSLWSMMGNHEKMHISSSVGSTAHMAASDSSSSSDLDDDLMDEDVPDEPYVTTPQISRTTMVPGLGSTYSPSAPGLHGPLGGSPAMNSLLSFQQRQRPRKQPKKKLRGPIGLGFNSHTGHGGGLAACKSPPNSLGRDPNPHSRRESISWAANQLNLSGNESDDNMKPRVLDSIEGAMGAPGHGGQNEVIRRVVHRRGNLLPKTKAFARMRAALAEENAPIDNEVRREAEVVRQVRDSDVVEHPARAPPPALSVATTALSSPTMGVMHDVDEMVDDAMVVDTGAVVGSVSALGLSSSFKQQIMKNSRVNKNLWDTFSESSSIGGAGGTTPPPPSLPRGSCSAMSVNNDDMSMDSPSANSAPSASMIATGGIFPMSMTTRSSSAGDTPQQPGSGTMGAPQQMPPTAAEITRRINNKRRRDDDFDPVSFKRRAVSPGVSAHNSPIMQSPLQRDIPWGSRPGSNGHDRAGGSESGGSQVGSQPAQGQGNRPGGPKGRVGYQGMVDTNDGITKLSIE